jgi:hypothetical protein
MKDQWSNLAVAPRDGFEPSTNRLTAGCSTAELPGSRGAPAYNKARTGLQSVKSRRIGVVSATRTRLMNCFPRAHRHSGVGGHARN